jgi:hypothetical protein
MKMFGKHKLTARIYTPQGVMDSQNRNPTMSKNSVIKLNSLPIHIMSQWTDVSHFQKLLRIHRKKELSPWKKRLTEWLPEESDEPHPMW